MEQEKTKSLQSIFSADALRKLMSLAALVVIFAGFSLASPNFLKFSNVVGILLATAVNGVLALGVTFVIITGGIDLSVGTMMTFAAVMTGVLVTFWGLPVWVGVLGGVITGGVTGLINGTVISRMKIPPFIATLGMLYATKGLSLIVSGVKPIYFTDALIFPNAADPIPFRAIATGSIFDKIIPGFAIPNAVIIMFLLAIAAHFLLNKTLFGRYTFAMGSNEEAARLSGVNVASWKTAVYAVCGMFSGMAGVLIAARLNSAQPALGAGYELDAIAAVVIGGTSLSGGEGSVVGTVIGAFVISVLTNGLRILSVPQEWQMVVTGVIVIIAVFADQMRRQR